MDRFCSWGSSTNIAEPHSERSAGIRRTATLSSSLGISARLIPIQPSGDKMLDDHEAPYVEQTIFHDAPSVRSRNLARLALAARDVAAASSDASSRPESVSR